MIPFNRGSGFQAERMQNGEPALSSGLVQFSCSVQLFSSAVQLSRESRNYSCQTDVIEADGFACGNHNSGRFTEEAVAKKTMGCCFWMLAKRKTGG